MLTVSFLMSDDINEKMQIDKQSICSGILKNRLPTESAATSPQVNT